MINDLQLGPGWQISWVPTAHAAPDHDLSEACINSLTLLHQQHPKLEQDSVLSAQERFTKDKFNLHSLASVE